MPDCHSRAELESGQGSWELLPGLPCPIPAVQESSGLRDPGSLSTLQKLPKGCWNLGKAAEKLTLCVRVTPISLHMGEG